MFKICNRFVDTTITLMKYQLSMNGFHDGLQQVFDNGKVGYIDEKGELVIPCKFDLAFNFHKGIAEVVCDGENFFIDKNGEVVETHRPSRYVWIERLSSDLYVGYYTDPDFGQDAIDPTGDIQFIEMGYCQDFMRVFEPSEGFIVAETHLHHDGDYYAFIPMDGFEQSFFKNARPFSDGLAAVVLQNKEKWCYVDHDFKIVIPAEYDDAGDFVDGTALVSSNGKILRIDKAGRILEDDVDVAFISKSEPNEVEVIHASGDEEEMNYYFLQNHPEIKRVHYDRESDLLVGHRWEDGELITSLYDLDGVCICDGLHYFQTLDDTTFLVGKDGHYYLIDDHGNSVGDSCTIELDWKSIAEYSDWYLADRICYSWMEDFMDEDSGEFIPMVRSFSLYEPGTRVDSIDLDLLSEKNVEDRNVRIVRLR